MAGKKQIAPLWEWAVAVLGVAIVAVVVGYMGYYALNGQDVPPAITIRVEEIRPAPQGYLVTFSARNAGGRAVAALQVNARLESPGGGTETAEARIDYVPAHSVRRGGLFFSGDPRSGRLRIAPAGFREP